MSYCYHERIKIHSRIQVCVIICTYISFNFNLLTNNKVNSITHLLRLFHIYSHIHVLSWSFPVSMKILYELYENYGLIVNNIQIYFLCTPTYTRYFSHILGYRKLIANTMVTRHSPPSPKKKKKLI